MFIKSAAVAPQQSLATMPKPTVVTKPTLPAVLPHLGTSYTPPKSNPVNLTGGVGPMYAPLQTGGTATNPAGNLPQAWGNTCGPNTIMAMEAAVDPTRAAQFQAMTPDQRAAYETAVMNSNTDPMKRGYTPGPNTAGGWGFDQMQWQVTNRFGGIDTKLTKNTYAGDQKAAADALVTALSSGRPVAIGLAHHWMAATDIRGSGASAEVLINDSWTGTSAWVPVSEIASGSNWVGKYFSGEGTGIPKVASSSNIEALVVPSSSSLNPDSTFRANEGNALADAQAHMSEWTRRALPTPTEEPRSPAAPVSPTRFRVPIAV